MLAAGSVPHKYQLLLQSCLNNTGPHKWLFGKRVQESWSFSPSTTFGPTSPNRLEINEVGNTNFILLNTFGTLCLLNVACKKYFNMFVK